MKQNTMRKVGVWVILIFTSLALIIPSVAIVWGIFTAKTQEVTINPDNIIITTATPNAETSTLETDELPVSTSEETR